MLTKAQKKEVRHIAAARCVDVIKFIQEAPYIKAAERKLKKELNLTRRQVKYLLDMKVTKFLKLPARSI